MPVGSQPGSRCGPAGISNRVLDAGQALLNVFGPHELAVVQHGQGVRAPLQRTRGVC